MELPGTSLLALNSSLHGRERRAQRGITKRDLQSAVRNGTKEVSSPDPKTGLPRWKYTFAGVVYITDHTSTQEVTSFATELHLEKVPIADRLRVSVVESLERIAANSSIVTSHTVIVVDQSASMRNADMNGHRSRSKGVYYSIAEEFTATQLYPPSMGVIGGPNTNFSDVVTLIEMRDVPTVVFERQPLSWILFNTFVDLADRHRKSASSHGNYLPSVQAAFRLLNASDHPKCSLSLFFLSDGKPSDQCTTYFTKAEGFQNSLLQAIIHNCSVLGTRLSFCTVGFGANHADFELLQSMAQSAKVAGARGSTFCYSKLNGSSLSTALTSLISSTSAMRTMHSRINVDIERVHALQQRVGLVKESYLISYGEITSVADAGWSVFNNTPATGKRKYSAVEMTTSSSCYRSVLDYRLIDGKYKCFWKSVSFQHPDATGIAVRKCHFGQGAERIVYAMTEINAAGQPVGGSLVAKDSLHVQHAKAGEDMREHFHKQFLDSQRVAQGLAAKFNAHLDRLQVDPAIPRIHYLDCSVYSCSNEDNSDVVYFLCERRIDSASYRKWNDNAGRIDGNAPVRGVGAFNPVTLAARAALPVHTMAILEEEDEDNDDDSDNSFDVDNNFFVTKGTSCLSGPSLRVQQLQNKVLPEDIPQAFTHFTYIFTKREKMVCDIQGVLDIPMHRGDTSASAAPCFLLTDPCIHREQFVGTRKYGLTNKGKKGMHDFFKTHQCNPICKLLGIDHSII